MGIVSISLNEKILEEIDKIQEQMGFSGRDEVIRSAVREMIVNEMEKSGLSGIVEGVITVANQKKYNEEISRIRHNYPDIINARA